MNVENLRMIPQADPMRRIERYRVEVEGAVARVLGGERSVLGPAVLEFEAAFAAYIGVAHCIGVNSGTDALAFALRGLGIERGDEVITTSLTAAGTGQAILHCGATPCFVEVDPETYCIDPAAVEAAITPRTAAIVPVHLFGHPADVEQLRDIADRHGLALVEDCAQAHGASFANRKLGGFGHAGAFSFYPTKNLGCIGDGGAIVTNDAALADRLRAMRSLGWNSPERISQTIGYNSRLDELQAAILVALLPHLDSGNAQRRSIAAAYRDRLQGLPIGLPADEPGAIYHQFAVTTRDRDALVRYLRDEAFVTTAVHYQPALHQHPAFSGQHPLRLPVTEHLTGRLLSLPIQPEVSAPNLDRIMDALREGARRCARS